jgi:hypothetical protein
VDRRQARVGGEEKAMGTFLNQDHKVVGVLSLGGGRTMETEVIAFSHGAPSAPNRYMTEMGAPLGGILVAGNGFDAGLQRFKKLSIICSRKPDAWYDSMYISMFGLMFDKKARTGSSADHKEIWFYNCMVLTTRDVSPKQLNSKPTIADKFLKEVSMTIEKTDPFQ